METGFFEVADASKVLAFTSLSEGKVYLKGKVDAYVEKHPSTKQVNVSKAIQIIDIAKNKTVLATSVVNFVLAHPSEGLRVIK